MISRYMPFETGEAMFRTFFIAPYYEEYHKDGRYVENYVFHRLDSGGFEVNYLPIPYEGNFNGKNVKGFEFMYHFIEPYIKKFVKILDLAEPLKSNGEINWASARNNYIWFGDDSKKNMTENKFNHIKDFLYSFFNFDDYWHDERIKIFNTFMKLNAFLICPKEYFFHNEKNNARLKELQDLAHFYRKYYSGLNFDPSLFVWNDGQYFVSYFLTLFHYVVENSSNLEYKKMLFNKFWVLEGDYLRFQYFYYYLAKIFTNIPYPGEDYKYISKNVDNFYYFKNCCGLNFFVGDKNANL